MSWTAPSDCLRQPTESARKDLDEAKMESVVYKGPYDTLNSAADALVTDDLIETGKYAKSWTLERVSGNYGVLTIWCGKKGGAAFDTVGNLLKEVWSLKSVRNDLSIYAYCGESNGEANRVALELWQAEQDGSLAKQFKYKDKKNETISLDEATKDLAKKILEGKESVIRFYALLICRRTYNNPPAECLVNLGRIDTPNPGSKAIKSSGVGTVINNHQWLKMQDDSDEDTKGQWTRIESWWGLLKTDAADNEPWDADFYGENRWQMPHTHSNS